MKKSSQNKARQARARHNVNCSLMPGKKMSSRKQLKELFVGFVFTEDRAIWNYKDIVKKYATMWRKLSRNRETERRSTR